MKLNRNLTVPYTPDPNAGWVGFDLDGTLAKHGEGDSIRGIGEPILPMLKRLRYYLAKGVRCKIYTARAEDKRQVFLIHDWLARLDIPPLEVTNRKDYQMLHNYDDRAFQVIPNTGIVVGQEDADDEPDDE